MKQLSRLQPLVLSFALLTAPARAQSQLFDDTVLHDVWLEMDPTDWETLRARFMENTYYRCDFTWNGTTAWNAGVRSRGSGSRSPVKPGLRLDFKRYDSAGRFLGLKALVLRNLVQDPPMLRERLAMKLFERVGLPAPREAFARLFVNGQYWGLYLIVEDINSDFLSSRFGESSGYLYEYQWCGPYYFEYLGPDPALYSPRMFEPKTNEKNPNPQPLVDMIRVANIAPDEDLARAMSAYLDVEKFLTHLAVETYVGETDGLLGDAGMNNFYLYNFARSTRFQFLPWDKNATFAWAEYSIWRETQRNVLVRRLLAQPELRRVYQEALGRVMKAAGGAGGWLEAEALRLYGLIRGAAREDTRKPSSNDEFETAIEDLLFVIGERARFVERSLLEEGYLPR